MWISFKHIIGLFEVSKQAVDDLREENAALKSKVSVIESELASTKVNLDWLRIQYNQLQLERTALMDKAYGIKVPTPELVRAQPKAPSIDEMVMSFDDMGDELAKRLGYDVYGN